MAEQPNRGPKQEGLRIGHINIHSLRTKLNVVRYMISLYDFDILAISETWLTRDVEDYTISMPGYTMNDFRVDKEKNSGGLLVYVRDNYTIDWERPETEKPKTVRNADGLFFQCITIEFTQPISLRLMAIYRHIAYKDDKFYTHLSTFFEKSKNNSILLGDFNIDYNDDDALEELKKLETRHKLRQRITQKTFFKRESSTCIDHIYTDFDEKAIEECDIIRSVISDHDLIYCTLKVDNTRPNPGPGLPADIARMRDEVVLQPVSVSHLMSTIHLNNFPAKKAKVRNKMSSVVAKLGEAKSNFVNSGDECGCTNHCDRCTRCKCKLQQCLGCKCKCKCNLCSTCECKCRDCTWRTCRKTREARDGGHQKPVISPEEVKSARADMGDPSCDSDGEETKAKIERGLCDVFNALLLSEQSEESKSEKLVYDTFESVLVRRTAVQQLKSEIKESLHEQSNLYACLYKFGRIALDEGLLEDIEVSDFPKKTLKTYTAQRKSNNAKPAPLQWSKLRELSEEINKQEGSDSNDSELHTSQQVLDTSQQPLDDLELASDNPVRSFHCGKEIIIVQMVEEPTTPEKLLRVLEVNELLLNEAQDKELIIFRNNGVNYSRPSVELLRLGEPKVKICFLGAEIDQHGAC